MNQYKRAMALTEAPNKHTPPQPLFAYMLVEAMEPVALPME